MKKLVTSLAVTSMLMGSTIPAIAAPNMTVQAYDEGGVQVLLKFKDLKEAQWALRFIAAMEAEGVFNGYPDGTFKPNSPINRAEAVATAVTLMGLKAEAEAKKDVTLNFKDAEVIKRNYGWATGYIAVALEKGLFDSVENELQPGKEASRLWVATLLVRALGYENEALTKMNTSLNFKDKSTIPAAAVGYIAVAVEKGILVGYPDGTFRPNNPVTRAEMAALLTKTGEVLPPELKQKKKHMKIEGVVTAVTADSITVQDEDRGEVQINLNNKILVFHGEGRGSASDIHVGDKVEIRLKNGRAILIDIKREAQKVKGTVVSVTEAPYQPITPETSGQTTANANVNGKTYKVVMNTDNGQQSFFIDSLTKIKVDGIDQPTVADIKTGNQVEAKLWGNLALEVKVLKDEDTTGKFEEKGKLVKIDTSSITIKKENQTEVKYDLAADLKIDYEGHPNTKLSDLTAGLNVKVEGKNNLVHKIEIED
jgi:hypothetical protein